MFLRLDVDQVEHSSANIVHPGVEMFRIQPVDDGLTGSDRRCCPVGTDRRHTAHDEDRSTAGGPVGRFPDSDPPKANDRPSIDGWYQPLAAGSLDANEMNTVDDSSRPTAGGPVGQLFSLNPTGPSSVSSGEDKRQPPCVCSLDKPWMTERLDDRSGEPDYERNTQTRSESESVSGVRDTVVKMRSEVRTDRGNITTDGRPTDSRETSHSSDSGVHSWTEQWENMSENSTDSPLYHTVGSHREDSRRVSQIEFRVPPNTEDEEDSDYPDTDGLLAKKSGGGPSEGMYGEDGGISYGEVTGGGIERNVDIAALSDFSDDSSEGGVGQQSECQKPVPVRPILPAEEDATIRRTPPVRTRSWIENILIDQGLTNSEWSRWDYGTLPEITDPAFVECINSLLEQRMEKGVDPRLDRYYPKLVQSLAKAGRLLRDTWEDHDERLKEQGTVCRAPGCQCRTPNDITRQTFKEELLRVDSVSDRFPDQHVRRYTKSGTNSDSQDEVPVTYTPPIRRRRSRKYASQRKYETDVEDYFSCSNAEERWTDRSYSWYQR